VSLVILAAKIGAFQEEPVKQFPACGGAATTREGLRRQLPSNILVQFLAGTSRCAQRRLGDAFESNRLDYDRHRPRSPVAHDYGAIPALSPRMADMGASSRDPRRSRAALGALARSSPSRSEIGWPSFWRNKAAASLILLGLVFTAA